MQTKTKMIKGKGGFAITILELVRVGIVLIFGMGAWFLYSSLKNYIQEGYAFTNLQMAGIGLGIILIVLFFVRYKPHHFLIGK